MNLAELPLQLDQRKVALIIPDYKPTFRKWLSDEQIAQLAPSSLVACDVEFFENYFYVGFKHFDSGGYFYAEMTPANGYQTNLRRLSWLMFWFRVITFNGRNYDLPMIEAALRGTDMEGLKQLSYQLITGERKRSSMSCDHIDLFEVAPLFASLKGYGGRLHCQRLQDLPFDPYKPITSEQAPKVRDYNCNDLDLTEALYAELSPAIKLREELSQQYGKDLRSHSDAQIAEAILETELRKATGKRFKAPELPADYTFRFTAPDFLRFQTPFLRQLLVKISEDTFRLDVNGYAKIPEWLDGFTFQFANNTFRMGGGGLHSNEQRSSWYSDERQSIVDYDVSSYYPYIILSSGIYPAHIGPIFLEVFKTIVNRRVQAKREKQMTVADSLKITSNGTFGKLSNSFSIVYSPDLGTYVTVCGQLLLLMQIEKVWILSDGAIYPISANTDGVVYLCPKGRERDLAYILKVWAEETSFPVEETRYKSYHARDVNNFIAVKEKGDDKAKFLDEQIGCKTKGAYCERGSALNSVLSHNPEHLICQDAVLRFLTGNHAVEETIRQCQDVRRFVTVRNVKGGAHKNGTYLGRVVRWYYAKGEQGCINYVLSGNKVPNTDGAKPLQELDGLPDDINFDWYIKKANETLADIGAIGGTEQRKLL